MGKEIAYIMFACVLFCSWVGNRFFGCNNVGIYVGHTDRHQAGQPKATPNVHRPPALLRYHEWYVCKDDKCNKEFEKRCKALGRSLLFLVFNGFYDMQVKHP